MLKALCKCCIAITRNMYVMMLAYFNDYYALIRYILVTMLSKTCETLL